VSDTTLVLLCVAAVAVLLDLVVPSGGLLTGTALALIIERALNWAGVAAIVRWPLAGLGMLITVGLAIRFGERISERLFPARVRTNVDRVIGLTGQVHALRDGAPVVSIEGDLWTARALDDAPLAVGQAVRVVALVDQVPVVQAVED
jgi:membrane protein implicated in regulation of membrane protease activity